MAHGPFLALDGGGSGCRAVLRRPGQPDLSAEGGPANAYTDPAGSAARIAALVAQLTEAAGLLAPPPVTAGIAGCRLPALAADLGGRLPFPARIFDDSVTVARGALGDRDGIVVGLGTGAFVVRQAGGRARHIGGWGFALGDIASGAWFGRSALMAALRAADGLQDADPLTQALADPHPLVRMRGAAPDRYAALAPLVFQHADTPTARRLIAAAVTEIELSVAALGGPGSEPVVLTGGLAGALGAYLPPALQSRLTAPAGTPLDGALALAAEPAR